MANEGKNFIPGLGKAFFITPDELSPIFGKALSGDLVLQVSPGTLGSSAAVANVAGFTRQVSVKLTTANGELHNWFNGTFAIAVTKSSTAGTVTIAGGLANVTLVNGVGVVTLNYAGTWIAADTTTLTVTGGTKVGYTVANKTSVDTLIA